eukprot:365707-Chlamydomonas_euryale.AAC.12
MLVGPIELVHVVIHDQSSKVAALVIRCAGTGHPDRRAPSQHVVCRSVYLVKAVLPHAVVAAV